MKSTINEFKDVDTPELFPEGKKKNKSIRKNIICSKEKKVLNLLKRGRGMEAFVSFFPLL